MNRTFMKRNDKYLKKILKGEKIDYLYHIGLNSQSDELKLMKNIKAVIMAGSPNRIKRMAKNYKGKRFKFKKNERFYAEYVKDVLFISHGMGGPSISICLHEILKMIYYIKKGSMRDVNKVFICRIGTSGGFNIPAGSLVLTKKALMPNLEDYYVKRKGREDNKIKFNSEYPLSVIKKIINVNEESKIYIGNTINCDDFYSEQLREDGAIIDLNNNEKEKLFHSFVEKRVLNMEMESAVIPAVCKSFGHKNYATICCTLLDRTQKDQVTSTPNELKKFSLNAEKAIFNYLDTF